MAEIMIGKKELEFEEDSVNGHICKMMDPKDVLVSIAHECPYDSRIKTCPIKEVQVWRNMSPKDAITSIYDLPDHIQRELAERHIRCSTIMSSDNTYRDKYMKSDKANKR